MEMKLKKGLGSGLSSLLGDTSKKIETNKVSIKDIKEINFSQENILIKIIYKS